MKKIFAIFVAMLFVVSLSLAVVGCKKAEETAPAPEVTTAPAPEAAPAPAPAPEAAPVATAVPAK